jgi:hypothetical protein
MKLCKDCVHRYKAIYPLNDKFVIREYRCKKHKIPNDIARKINGYCNDAKDFEPTLWYKIKRFLRWEK